MSARRTVGRISLIVVLLVSSFACLWAQEEEPEPIPQTTRFLHPLQQHDEKLAKLAAEIERLYRAPETASDREAGERAEAIEAAARAFLVEGRAFQKTVTDFMRGETRRGLDLEVDLVRDGVQIAQQTLVTCRQLSDASFVAISEEEEMTLFRAIRTIVEDELRARIAARLEAEGLKDIVDAKTWEEARQALERRVSEQVRTRIEQETERILGLGFSDRATFQRALRRRINQEIERKIEQVFVRISHSSLVVEFAGALAVEWVTERLWTRVWPAIREAFREKGRHPSRLARSRATMEAARMKLMELDREAPIREVEARIRNARTTIVASRYLRQDLERAGETDMLGELETDIAWLEKAVSFTQKRFLMHKESLVARLKVDQDVLAETLDELERLLRGVTVPDWAENKAFVIKPFQNLGEEGIVATGFGGVPASGVYLVGSSISLEVIDLDLAEEARKRLADKGEEAAGMSVLALSRRDSRIVRRYPDPFLVRIVVAGQVRYGHRTKGSQSFLGGGGVFGLTPGEHQVAVTIATADGFRCDETFTLTTQPWSEDFDRSIAANRHGVEVYEEALEKAKTEREVAAAATSLHGQLVSLAGNLLHHSATTGDEVVPLYRRRLEMAILGHKADPKNGRRNEILVSSLQSLVYDCSRIGDVKANAVALEAAALAERTADRKNRTDIGNMRRIWFALANLAVSSSNDVAAAHEHLEKWLDWSKLERPTLDEARERDWWPEPISLGGARD